MPKQALKLAEEIKQIIAPLKRELGITDFHYIRKYKDESRIWLATDPEWQDYLQKELSYVVQIAPKLDSNTGYIIWDYRRDKEGDKFAEKRPNKFHSMHMITNYVNYVETFGFSTKQENNIINYYYEYAQDIFYRFKFYFLDKASRIIDIAEQNRIELAIPGAEEPIIDNSLTTVNEMKHKLFKVMEIKKLHICDVNGKNIVITKKEIECIKWIMLGKSSAEIATILGVGLTTVNTHIKNIKRKVGLFKVGQLIKFFCKHNLDCVYN